MRHLVLVATLLMTAPAWAAPEVVIKMATVAPEGTPWAKQLKKFRKLMHKASGGRIKIKVYMGFAKGGEKSIVRRCVQGSLQMCGVSVGALATVAGDLNVLELPYLFKNWGHADAVLDGGALPLVKKILNKKGLVFYGWSENGWRGFGAREKAIRKPGDIKGLRMRAQESRVHLAMYRALGAKPVTISLPEVLGSLERGVVDGYDNTVLYAFATSWHKHTKYYTRSAHIYQPAMIVYNKKFLDSVKPDLRQILLTGAQKITNYGRRLIRKMDKPLVDNLKAEGVKVIELNAGQKQAFRKATQKAYRMVKKHLTSDGKKLLKLIQASRAKH